MFSRFLFVVLTNVLANAHLRSFSDQGFANDIIQRLGELERRGNEQHVLIEILRKENAQLRDTHKDLVEEIKNLKEENRQLIERQKQYERVVNSKIAEENCCGLKEKDGNSEESSNKPGHARIRHTDEGSTVAFFASRSAHSEHLGQNQAVVFDRAVTNVGQAYHNTTGTFIAPIPGIYVFSTTLLTWKETANFNFVVNGHIYSHMYSYYTDSYETVSQTVIFSLNKGDDVTIQSQNSDKYVNGNHYSTFSGFLLVPTEGPMIIG